ncbi:MAG TPA: hypothetical protein VGJ86_13190 [Acidimicrobiales bacterium]|jgi:hypothetical protein
MVWILLAALGVSLWLVVGGLLYTLWSRRRVRHQPGVFACRLRPAGRLDGSTWSRTKRYGCWAHDVLLVHRGLTLTRCDVLSVANVTGPVPGMAVKGFGARPVWLRLHLDDGEMMDLVAWPSDATHATGPFVVASMR